jgi:hypothetical protein
MKQGWTMRDIDDMDILFYFSLISHAGKKQKKVVPIDQVGFL